jgi:hypothetical protein
LHIRYFTAAPAKAKKKYADSDEGIGDDSGDEDYVEEKKSPKKKGAINK